ncbi:MAG TPA: hypothetical protein VL856_08385 [Acidimicrobiia bacterium]|nr:hypothetical protein [Acidimicrobiia bacterium]
MRILVLGTERSGTTWVARALASADDATYVHEPDNADANPLAADAKRGLGLYPALRAGEHVDGYARLWDHAFAGGWPSSPAVARVGGVVNRMPPVVRRLVAGAAARVSRRRSRVPQIVVVKSVHAPFAVDWLVERYRPAVVIVRRDPLNVVASLIRLGTTPAGVEARYEALQRPAVRERYVEPMGLQPPEPGAGMAFRLAWWIAFVERLLTDHAHREGWTVVSHDTMCASPMLEAQRLCEELGVEDRAGVMRFISASDRPGEGFSTYRLTAEQPGRWKDVLDPSQVAQVQSAVASLARR